MRLYRIIQIHRITGLSLGAVLFILGFSGFFLDHENFDFLWSTRVSNALVPAAIINKTAASFSAFEIDTADSNHFIVAARSGIYVSHDRGKLYRQSSTVQTFAIVPEQTGLSDNYSRLFAATSDGVYLSDNGGENWRPLALTGQVVESLSYFQHQVFAVVDKSEVYRVAVKNNQAVDIELLAVSKIDESILPKQITLGRLVRDLHYGRGLFSGISSLLINDFSALVLVFLAISGLIIYLITRNIRLRKHHHKKRLFTWRLLHANRVMIYAFIPIVLLLITGVFLDHSDFFRPLMKQTRLSTAYLPPVYRDLSSDIWGFDFDGESYRIGNRLGVFKSSDLKYWQLDSKGFAWRMKRLNGDLYISGMGAPNRVLQNAGWKTLTGSPHMPRDITLDGAQPYFLTRKVDAAHPLPKLESVSLYAILLGLHDGEFFHPLWVFINDLAALAAIILLITGYIKWQRHNKKNQK